MRAGKTERRVDGQSWDGDVAGMRGCRVSNGLGIRLKQTKKRIRYREQASFRCEGWSGSNWFKSGTRKKKKKKTNNGMSSINNSIMSSSNCPKLVIYAVFLCT